MTASTNRIVQACARTNRTRLLLVRHLESELAGRFCGQSDPPLSAEGRSSIPALVQSVRALPVSAVFCSDLRRARETAAPIGKQFRLACHTSKDLREIYFGRWEGLTWNEVEQHFPNDARAWSELFPHYSPPDAESFWDFRNRVICELGRLADENQNAYAIVVTHAGFIRSAISWVLKIPDGYVARIGQDYGGVTLLEKDGNSWTVPMVNVRLHLSLSVPKLPEDRV